MIIYITTKKGNKVFKLWAACLAVFLSISLVVTLNPVGKNAKAYAQTNTTSAEQSQEGQQNDNYADTTSQDDSDETDNNYQDDVATDDTSASNANTEDEDLSGLNNYLTSLDDADSDLDLSSLDENIDYDELIESLFSDILNADTDDNESDNNEYNPYTALDDYFDALFSNGSSSSYVLDNNTNDGADITDKSKRYDQFRSSSNSEGPDLNSPHFIDCNYKYHVTEDQSGVFLDGFSYVNADDYRESNETTKSSVSKKTLYIPSTIKLHTDDSSPVVSLPVLGISDGAFEGQTFFDQVYLAYNEEDDLAFYQYLAVESNAFNGCYQVRKVVSARNTLLGESCFANCDMLETAIFKKNVAQIEDKVFENCSSLNWVYWGNTYINQFSQVAEEFQIGDSFYTFGSEVFSGCNNLEKICVPFSIKYVSDRAFVGAPKLKELVFSANLKTLGENILQVANCANSFEEENTDIQKIVFLSGESEFNENTFIFSQDSSSKLNDGSFKIYSYQGSNVMNRCRDYNLPFEFNFEVIANSAALYSQREADEGQEVEVKDDQRTHKTVSYKVGDGSKERPYLIYNFSDLKTFANTVNLGQSDACAILMKDISSKKAFNGDPVSSNNWLSIGAGDKGWSGTFDGNNFTIDGLTQDTFNESTMKKAMWGDIGVEIVSSIGVSVLFALALSNPVVAGLAAFFSSAAIMVGGFFFRNYWRSKNFAGGFVDKTESGFDIHDVDFINVNFAVQNDTLGGLISSSNGDGKISSVTMDGVISPKNSWNETNYGGMIGHVCNGDVSINTCANNSFVKSNSYAWRNAGGLIGKADGDVDITKCSNTGGVVGNGAGTSEILTDVICIVIFASIDGISAFGAAQEKMARELAKLSKSTRKKMQKCIEDIFSTNSSLNHYLNDSIFTSKYKNLPPEERIGLITTLVGELDQQGVNKGIGDLNAINSSFVESFKKITGKNLDIPTVEDFFPFNYLNELQEIAAEKGGQIDVLKLEQRWRENMSKLSNKIEKLPGFLRDEYNKVSGFVYSLLDTHHNQVVENFCGGSEASGFRRMKNNLGIKEEYDLRNARKVYMDVITDERFTNAFTKEGGKYHEQYKKLHTILDNGNELPTLYTIKGEIKKSTGQDISVGIYDNKCWTDMMVKDFEQGSLEYDQVLRNLKETGVLPPSISETTLPATTPDLMCFCAVPFAKRNNPDEWLCSLIWEEMRQQPKLQFISEGKRVIVDLESQEAKNFLNANYPELNILYNPLYKDGLYSDLETLAHLKNYDLFPERLDFGQFLRETNMGLEGQTWLNYVITGNMTFEQGIERSIMLEIFTYVNSIDSLCTVTEFASFFNYALRTSSPSFIKWALIIGVTNTDFHPFRQFVQMLVNDKKRKSNSDVVDPTGEVSTVTRGTYDTATDSLIPDNNSYKNITSTSTSNDASKEEEKIKTMCEEIPSEAIEGENVDDLARRSAVMYSVDATQYCNLAKQSLTSNLEQYAVKGFEKGFGTFTGVGSGFVGKACGNSKLTFTECKVDSSAVGGETAGGFLGHCDTNNEVIFDKCTTTKDSTFTAVDSGQELNADKQPAAGGFIGLQTKGKTYFKGCVSASTQTTKINGGGFIARLSGGETHVDYSVSTGMNYIDWDGAVGGFFGSTSVDNIYISNSYYDGIVASEDSEWKGCIVGSSSAGLHASNVYYYANTNVLREDQFAKSYAFDKEEQESSDGIYCMKDTKMLQTGELAARLNDGIGEGVFGQNLGVIPVVTIDSSTNGGEEKSKLTYKASAKAERPLPFLQMPVFKYVEKSHNTSSDGDYAFVSQDANTTDISAYDETTLTEEINTNLADNVSATLGDVNSQNYSEMKFFNYPTTSVLNGKVNFIDVDCDEHSICKPEGRIYVNAESEYKVQMLGTDSYEIKQVLLDNNDITNEIKLNPETMCYEYTIKTATNNHYIQIFTEYKNQELEPEFVDGYYLIKNLGNMLWYKNHYTQLIEDKKPANARLVTNLDFANWSDLTGKLWDGIGDYKTPYQSEFDGFGFTINNVRDSALFNTTNNASIHDLVLNNFYKSDSALVGKANGGLNIKNVKLQKSSDLKGGLIYELKGALDVEGCCFSDCRFTTNGENQNCGSIASIVDNGKNEINVATTNVSNCSFSSYLKKCNLGGLFGSLKNKNKTNIDKCEVNVKIEYTGPEEQDNCHMGGLIGQGAPDEHASKVDVSNSVVGGELNNVKACYAAGVGIGIAVHTDNIFVNFSKLYALPLDYPAAVAYITDTVTNGQENTYINSTPNLDYIEHHVPAPKSGTGMTYGCRLENMEPSSPLLTGEIAYELAQHCDMFVQKIDQSDLVIANVPTLNLKFKTDGPDYVVRFDGNGADNFQDEMDPVFYEKNTSKKLPKNTYVREGYTFAGWSLSKGDKPSIKDEEEYSISEYRQDRELTLYAMWNLNIDFNPKANEQTTNDTNAITDESAINEGSDSYTYVSEAEESDDVSEKVPGRVYKYKRESNDTYYYSNLTDDNSYIVKPDAGVSNVDIPEMRVESGKPASVTITPNAGYKLGDVTYEVIYNKDEKEEEKTAKKKQFRSNLQGNENCEVATFENVYEYGEVVIDAETKTYEGVKPEKGDGTATNPYIVKTKENLLYIAKCVNDGVEGQEPNGDIYVNLEQSISVQGIGFPGIGTQQHPFKGHFYGGYTDDENNIGHYVISGFDDSSLFGYTDGASIKDVDVVGNGCKGSILVNYANNNTEISNINTSGVVTSDAKHIEVGPVVGILNNSKVVDCVNTKCLATSEDGKDIVIGGIVGLINGSATVEGCTNYGAIFAATDKCYSLGGIVGRIYSMGQVQISKCINDGKIDGEKCYAGGIVGAYYSSKFDKDPKLTITYCENITNIEGKFSAAGGILGLVKTNDIDRYVTTGGIKRIGGYCHVDYCLNNGIITSEKDAGGFLGRNDGFSGPNFHKCVTTVSSVVSNNDHQGLVCGSCADLYLCDVVSRETYCCDISKVDAVGDRRQGDTKIDRVNVSDFVSGNFILNTKNVLGEMLCQNIDREDNGDRTLHIVYNDSQKQDLQVHKINKTFLDGHTEEFNSNYTSEELCYINIQPQDDNISVETAYSHYAPNKDFSFTVKSTGARYIDSVSICDKDGNIIKEFTNNDTNANSLSYDFNFEKTGDYIIKSSSKLAEYKEPEKDADGSYLVKTSQDLAYISQAVNWHNATNLNIKVVSDIDMSNILFAPIGTQQNPFKETFSAKKQDGSGSYTISNINIADTNTPGSLFGYIDSATIGDCNISDANVCGSGFVYSSKGSIIRNIDIKQSTVNGYVDQNNSFAAGILAISGSNNQLINCSNYSNITANEEGYSNFAAGILAISVGECDTLWGCNNNGQVTADNVDKKHNAYCGGIVSVYSPNKAGSASIVKGITIYSCSNNTSIHGSNCVAGGIISNISTDMFSNDTKTTSSSASEVQVSNYVTTIKNSSNIKNVGTLDDNIQICGGLIGQVNGGSSTSVNVISCSADSKTEAESKLSSNVAGGMFGQVIDFNKFVVSNSYVNVHKVGASYNNSSRGLLVGDFLANNKTIECYGLYASKYRQVELSSDKDSTHQDEPKELTTNTSSSGNLGLIGTYAALDADNMTSGELLKLLNSGKYKNSNYIGNVVEFMVDNNSKLPKIVINDAENDSPSCVPNISGLGTQDNPYVIDKAFDFVELQYIIQKNPSCWIKMKSDVDMSGMPEFVGLGSQECPFVGNFIGQIENENGNFAMFTISGLKTALFNFTGKQSKAQSIFVAEETQNATISGFKVINAEVEEAAVVNNSFATSINNISVDNSSVGVGCLAANVQKSTIASVKIVNSSVGSAKTISAGAVAGIVADNTTITKCSVNLKSGVTCKNFGAVVGEVAGSNVDISKIEFDGNLVVDNCNEDCHVGGVVGATTAGENISISNIDNKASLSTINGKEWSGVGGLVGCVWQNTKELNITSCSAFGATGSSTTNGYVGGFIGKVIPVEKDSVVRIKGCGNIEDTSSCKAAGGFVGQFDSNEVKLNIESCFNADKVSATNTDSNVDTYAGGFFGRIDKVGPDKGHQAISLSRVYSMAFDIDAKYAGKVCGMAPEKYNPTTSNILIDGIVAENSKGISGKNDIYVPSVSEHNEKDFQSGEVCWLLNGQQDNPSGDYVYLQTIDKTDIYQDKDKYPKLENAEKVYNISKTYGQHVLSNYNHEVYHVKTADDLVKLVDFVDSGKVDIEVVLDNDIDMNGTTWDKPIGHDSNKPFCGCFNGSGHIIKNLNGLALVGYTSVDLKSSTYCNNSIINNVKFENAHTKGAVLVQNASRTEIYNVETSGVVDPSIQLTPMQSPTENGTGAIVGSANKETKVHDCKNYCYVSGTTMYVGGVVGYMQGNTESSTGYVYGSSIQNCQNYGDVVISVLTDPFSADFNSGSAFEDSDEVDTSEIVNNKQENQYEDYVQAKPELKPNEIIVAGGVLGSLGFYSSIDKCTNEGVVSSAYLGEKSTMLGGVLGQVYMYNMNAELNDCVNTGNILGGTFAGGLVGNVCMAKLTISNCNSVSNVLGSCEYGSAGIGAIWLNANVDINNSDVECKTNDSANPAVLCSYVESNLYIGEKVRLHKALCDMYKTVGQGRVIGDYIPVDTPAEQTNVQSAANNAVKVNLTPLKNGSASINGITSADENNISVDVNANSKVVITLQPDEGYMTDVVRFGDKQADLNGKDTFELEVGTDNIDVNVSFKESTEIVSNPTKEDPDAYKLVRENKVFTKWTSDRELPTESGNYYLTKDVVLSTAWNVPAGANISLSLDGHSITQGGDNMNVIEVNNGANLEVYDLRTNGRCFYFEEQKDASGKQVGPWKLLGDNATYKAPADFPEDYRCDGGIITGSTGDKGCGIEVAHGGSAVMHQGNIVGNIGNISAGGVNNHGTFVDKHAYIVGNYGKYVGGIVNHTDGVLTLNYVVAHNVAEVSVGGIRNVGVLNSEALTQVSGNILNCSDSAHPGVYKPAYSDLSLSTIDVLNNNKDDLGDKVTQSCRINFTGVNVNPYGISYTLDNFVSLGPLNWVLTSNFAKHTIHPNNTVAKFKITNPQYKVDIVDGELKVVKK